MKEQIYHTLNSVSFKGRGRREAWQGLIRFCNSNNNIFIKLINWESRGNCYVCCRLTMLLMLTTVKLTNNKLWNMDFLPSQHVLITYHLSIAKGDCQDGISDKMLTCDKTHLPERRTIQFEIEFVRLSRKTFLLILPWGKVILIKKKRTEGKFFLPWFLSVSCHTQSKWRDIRYTCFPSVQDSACMAVVLCKRWSCMLCLLR